MKEKYLLFVMKVNKLPYYWKLSHLKPFIKSPHLDAIQDGATAHTSRQSMNSLSTE
jgi:hypothetical protein